MSCGGFGSVAFGSGAFGSEGGEDPGLVLALVPYSGLIDVTLEAPSDEAGFPDAWMVEAVESGELITVIHVEGSGNRWQLFLASALEAETSYRVDLSCEAEAIVSWEPTDPPPQPEAWDIANPHLIRDAGIVDPPPLGQHQINDHGDIALESRLQGVRKRILRRMTTLRGEFFHLPEYGVGQPIKDMLRPALLRALEAEIRSQVRREPEVVSANVKLSQPKGQPSILVIAVSARTTLGLDVAASQTIDLRNLS